MSETVIVCGLSGCGVGLGLLMLLRYLRPTLPPTQAKPRIFVGDRRTPMLSAAATAFVTLALTRWVAVAVGLGALAAFAPWFFGGARVSRASMDRLEGLASWAESLRDLVATGAALPEAIPRTLPGAPAALRGPIAGLADRIALREPLDDALLAMADELDDPAGDLLVASLVLNARVQGRQLVAVLSALAASLRAELDVRRKVEADRRSTRRAVQVVVSVTVAMVLGLALLNRSYVAPYERATGQVVLAVITAVYALGFIWLRRLADFAPPRRFLAEEGGGKT
jgi:Flp pilus assembly protein TadB